MRTSLPSLLPEIVCGIVCRPDCWRTWRLCMVFARGCARGFLFVVSALCGLLAWNRPACRPPAAKGPLCLRYLRDLRILRDASSLKTEATEWIRAAMPKCQAVPPSSSAVWPGLISLDRTGLGRAGLGWQFFLCRPSGFRRPAARPSCLQAQGMRRVFCPSHP